MRIPKGEELPPKSTQVPTYLNAASPCTWEGRRARRPHHALSPCTTPMDSIPSIQTIPPSAPFL